MKTLSPSVPTFRLNRSDFPDDEKGDSTFRAVQLLMQQIEDFRRLIVIALNYNRMVIYDQNDQPTINDGSFALWKDADATSGNPTHYLVANDGTDTVTFASEELVP